MLKTSAPGPKSTSAPLRTRESTWPSVIISGVVFGFVAMVLFKIW